MLITLKDEQGNLKAVCEYYLVDVNGNFQVDGEWVWVNEVEINPEARNNGILKTFAKTIMAKHPNTKCGYFWRQKKYPSEKYPDRKLRIYYRTMWKKLLGEQEEAICGY